MGDIAVNSKVLSKTLAGEEVLLDLETGAYFGMNQTATFVWSRLKDGKPVPAIVAALANEYAISAQQAEADVMEFIAALAELKIVKK